MLLLLAALVAGSMVRRHALQREGAQIDVVRAAVEADYRVDLNTAGPEELGLLPGVGPEKAERIIAWRKQNRGFRSVDDLARVPGFSGKTLEAVRPFVTCSEPQ